MLLPLLLLLRLHLSLSFSTHLFSPSLITSLPPYLPISLPPSFPLSHLPSLSSVANSFDRYVGEVLDEEEHNRRLELQVCV